MGVREMKVRDKIKTDKNKDRLFLSPSRAMQGLWSLKSCWAALSSPKAFTLT